VFAKNLPVLGPKKSMKLKGTHDDTTRPNLPGFPPVTSSSKTTNGNSVSRTPHVKKMPEFLSNSTPNGVEVVVYSMEPSSSTSVSHHGYDVPMIQPFVAQTSHSDGNLDDQLYTSQTNDNPDFTPNTQPPPLPSRRSLERDIAVAMELSVSWDFASDKPSNSPYVQNPLLNSTTDSSPISPKDNGLLHLVLFFLNEAINNFPSVWTHLRAETPGSVMSSGGSSLGWALGAAVGAYIGNGITDETAVRKKYELVVVIVGDGSFFFFFFFFFTK
jgi:hypothetical protein